MCGSEGRMYKSEIEGSVLTVCETCSKHGKVLNEVREEILPKKEKKAARVELKKAENEIIFILVDGFAEKIKKRREYLGIKQEDFAKSVNEKTSLIHNIETGKFRPGIEQARKLEKVLKLKLVEQYEEKHDKTAATSDEEFTIGDLIKINKK